MGSPVEQHDNPSPAQCLTVKVGYVVYLDLIQLNPDLGNTGVTKVLYVSYYTYGQNDIPYTNLNNSACPGKKWTICGTFGPKFPLFFFN
jgi:hypothetical protein